MSVVTVREFCSYCHGSGMRWDSTGEGWKDCVFCAGSGDANEYQ